MQLPKFIQDTLDSKLVNDDIVIGVPTKKESEFLQQSISALANQPEGGWILYGIGSKFQLVDFRKNQSLTEKKVRKVAEELLFPQVEVSFEEYNYQGHPILAVAVLAASNKPVCISNRTPLQAFYRVNGKNKLLSTAQIAQLMADTAHESVDSAFFSRPWEIKEILQNVNFNHFRELLGMGDKTSDSDVLSALESEGLIVKAGSKFWVKKLAVLTFPNKQLHYYAYNEIPNIKILVTTELSRKKGEQAWRNFNLNSLCTAPIKLYDFIKTEFRRSFSAERRVARRTGTKVEESYLSLEIIKELIINAASYTDFNNFNYRKSFLKIGIFSDRINFYSRGECELSPDRIFDKKGKCYNPMLREWLIRLYSEDISNPKKGLLVIISEAERLKLPPPEFIISESSFDVRIYTKPISEFKDLNVQQRKLACYQHAALKASENNMMTNKSLRRRMMADPKHYPRCSKIIAELIKEGKIKRINKSKSNRDAVYVPYWYNLNANK